MNKNNKFSAYKSVHDANDTNRSNEKDMFETSGT